MTDYQCAYCGAKNAAYGSHCHECGDDWANAVEVPPSVPPEKRPRDLRAEGDELRCPGCSGFLEAARALKGCYACSRCGGVWLDNAASTLLVHGMGPSIFHWASLYERAAVSAAEIPNAKRLCPIGLEPLTTVTVEDAVIDVCNVHGTWFDVGELRKVSGRVGPGA
jgi:Zn-finger nucleic acid-binding protein